MKKTKGEEKRRTRGVKRGRTLPSCKSNYAFFMTLMNPPMRTNKRRSKTGMRTGRRRGVCKLVNKDVAFQM